MRREIAHITEAQRCGLRARLLEVWAIQRDTRERYQIEQALARMEDGAYGLCIECGAALPFVRLDAVPQAARCVQCESENERRKARSASL